MLIVMADVWTCLKRDAWPASVLSLVGPLCVFILAGCITPAHSPPPITDVALRVQALLPLDALLLGEQHDNPDHQRIHREVIEALAARGALGAVVIEMAQRGASTQPLGASASEDAARAALQWDDKAWHWSAYAPAIMAAVRAGVVVIGANLPREQMREAMRQANLDTRLSGPALKAQQRLIRSGHCDLLPESQVSPMTRIQIARDVAMAATVAEIVAGAKAGGKTVLLLAGSGHVDSALGVPQHFPPEMSSKSVLLGALPAASNNGRAAGFDLVWPTALAPAKDYCADLKANLERPS